MDHQQLKHQLRQLQAITASPRLRQKIDTRISLLPQTNTVSFIPQFAVRLALAFLALLIIGGGVTVAANQSRPGDLLYPIKSAVTGVKNWVVPVQPTPEPTQEPAPTASASAELTTVPAAVEKKDEADDDQERDKKEDEDGNNQYVLGDRDNRELDKDLDRHRFQDWDKQDNSSKDNQRNRWWFIPSSKHLDGWGDKDKNDQSDEEHSDHQESNTDSFKLPEL